jgi:hypothetical protein
MKHLFTGTYKHFDTPLGVVETDVECMRDLVGAYGERLVDDDRPHRMEHSIELQAVFLRHLFPHGPPPRILPLLVGSFHTMVQAGASPWGAAEVREFVEALRAVVQGRKVCFIAAADLAHIGTRFGDAVPATEALMAQVARGDGESLDAAVAGSAEGWFTSNAKDGDRRRVCGLSPVYTFLRVLGDQADGRLLQYLQCNEPTGSNNVTIAGVVYHARAG